MPTELEIDGIKYRTGSLNAKMQFHVARRLAPLVAKIGTTGLPEDTQNLQLFSVLADSIKELSDDDCDYIIRVCMSVVLREQNGHWMNAWNKAADQPQFADMSVGAMMQLTIAVIQDNLGSFMPAQVEAGQQATTSRPNVH